MWVMRWCALQANTNPEGVAFDPVFKRRDRRQLAKRVVDFHRVEARGVVFQEILRGKFGGIKIRFPARVSESGGAGIQLSMLVINVARLMNG